MNDRFDYQVKKLIQQRVEEQKEKRWRHDDGAGQVDKDKGMFVLLKNT